MTTEEAKKAGFRPTRTALMNCWHLTKAGSIENVGVEFDNLSADDFPTRAKAREALRKRKADAEHAKWLADMQAQATPITKEQAKMLREGDSWYYYNPVIKSISECVKLIAINADQSFGRYFTRSAAQAALDEAKTEAEPLEWCEREDGDLIQPDSGDDISIDGGKTWKPQWKSGVIFDTVKGDLRARYSNPLWLAKHGRKGMVFNNNTNRWEPDTSALDELVKQAQELHMGYETDKPYVESHETQVGETQTKEVVTDETQPTILEEAAKCVTGPRRRDYGTPDENFGLIASLWSVQLKHEVTPMQVAMCLILLKVARQSNSPKRDNLVDIAGYAQCASELKGAK